MSNSIRDLLADTTARRARDAERWATLDEDACQMCDAHGQDKRSLFLSCFYAVHEVIPEAIDLFAVPPDATGMGERGKGFYYLRICKSCRARFLGHLRAWRDDCVALRGRPKDHDGYVLEEEDEPERNIPVRIDGAVVMLTRAEWDARRASGTGL